MQIDHLPGRSLFYRGEEWLYFSGTAYLGLARHPGFLENLQEGFRRYGANFGGSRLSNMQLAIYGKAEAFLADWLGAQAVLTTSSGSLAGQLLIKYLETQGPCYCSPATHPAMIGQAQPFEGSYQDWIRHILFLSGEHQGIIQLVTSSVDALCAELYPLDWISKLPANNNYRLIIDDSHGLGVLGETGKGVIELLPQVPNVEYIIMSSMGKALGTPGGLIAGTQSFIKQLWQRAFFGGASPIIPAFLYAYLSSQDILEEQRLRLAHNIYTLESALQKHSEVNHVPGHPIFFLKSNRWLPAFQKNKILISSFPYPKPNDPLINRIVINAAHTKADLEKLITLIRR
ncbi:MAG: aminotransferase class I/II-fold pyridoxal phosphate-dependent enzyme [Bacteroidota bacterium]